MQVKIVTGDKDSFQLIDANTSVLFTRKGISETEVFDESHLNEVYGIEPWQIVDLKGLMGDSSDGIPGIPGIGEKTALKLLADHHDLEGVLAAAGEYAGKKLGERLTEHCDLARLSKRLAEIDREAPITVSAADMAPKDADVDAKIRLYGELGFRGMLAEALREKDRQSAEEDYRVSADKAGAGKAGTDEAGTDKVKNDTDDTIPEIIQKNPDAPAAVGGQDTPEVLDDPDESRLSEYLKPLAEGGRLYLLPLVYGKNKRSPSWIALAIQVSGQKPLFLRAKNDQIPDISVRSLKPYLESGEVTKTLIDAKQMFLALFESGVRLSEPYEDLSLMGYLLNPSNPWQALEGLGELEPDMFARMLKARSKEEGLNDFISPRKAASWLAAMETLSASLKERLINDEMWDLYKNIEEPLAVILGEMEIRGIRVKPEALEEQGDALKRKLTEEEEAIYVLAGRRFNINSPKQLGEILFDTLSLPKGKKTKTGYSTDVDTLEFLARDHEIAGRIIQYRQYAKLLSTYVEGLLAVIDRNTGRIHGSLNQTITVTGRLSSTEPNLQNIPIRMEEGRRIRKAFAPSPGNRLLSGDYSQIELRILAHLCGDEALVQAFREGQDIHRSTASEVFGVSPENVTPRQRTAAKAVNFGLIYGISDFGLAQDLGISREEARTYMDRYFNRYPGVKTYFDRQLSGAAEDGFARTLFNRRRYLPELRSHNYNLRSFGQRAAMNAPIQGTAADIMKLAMVGVKRLLSREGLGDAMVLQVHDELLFDMPADRISSLKDAIKRVMEGVASLSVPLVVDMKVGDDWYVMEDI